MASGSWIADNADAMQAALDALGAAPAPAALDLAGVERLDMFGAYVLVRLRGEPQAALTGVAETQRGLIDEMGNMAQAMVSRNHPDSKVITQRQHLLSQGMKNLQKLASQRRQRLVDSVSRHEYLREAESILAWINEQMITAASEDYGQDYEHLLVSLEVIL